MGFVAYLDDVKLVVPGHAGVAINETVHSLANPNKTPVPLQLYSAHIKPLTN